jgi:hypothetical protein
MPGTTQTALGTMLYAGAQEDIFISGKNSIGEYQKTNSSGPAKIGFSKYRVSNVNSAVKYGYQSKLLDELLINHSVNAYESSGTIYCEIIKGSEVRHALCTGDKVQWEGNTPHGSTKILPYVLFALSSSSSLDELKEAFQLCVQDYNANGKAQVQNLLLFNDSFYYGFAKGKDVLEEDNFAVINQAKQAVNTGLLNPMDILKNINGLPELSIQNSKTTKKAAAPTTVSSDYKLFEQARAGELIIPYKWEDSRKHKIPSLNTLENYVPCEQFYSILRKIKYRQEKILARMDAGMTGAAAIGNDYVNIMVTGRPGTGKTTLAYRVAAALGYVVSTMGGTKNTDSDEFEGKTKVVNGSLASVDTDFLDVFQNGGIIVVEEVNMIDTNVLMGTIGQAIEFPFVLKRQGYDTIIRHPMCVVIHNMNVGTEGARPINEAYSNRSKQTYTLNDTKEEDAISILMSQGFGRKESVWAYRAYLKVENHLRSTDVNRPEVCLNIGIRSVIGCLQNMEEGDSPEKAFANSVAGKIGEVDLELYEDVMKTIVASLPELK